MWGMFPDVCNYARARSGGRSYRLSRASSPRGVAGQPVLAELVAVTSSPNRSPEHLSQTPLSLPDGSQARPRLVTSHTLRCVHTIGHKQSVDCILQGPLTLEAPETQTDRARECATHVH